MEVGQVEVVEPGGGRGIERLDLGSQLVTEKPDERRVGGTTPGRERRLQEGESPGGQAAEPAGTGHPRPAVARGQHSQGLGEQEMPCGAAVEPGEPWTVAQHLGHLLRPGWVAAAQAQRGDRAAGGRSRSREDAVQPLHQPAAACRA